MKIPDFRLSFFLLVFSLLMIYGSMAAQSEFRPIIFTNGEDTSTCGGYISTDSTKVTFTSVPLAVESDIVITQLVNITNRDSSSHSVLVYVGVEDFRSELSSLKIYFVSPSGIETLVVELDDSGNVIKDKVSVKIPQEEEWAVKLVGHYDSGTSSTQSNTMTLTLQMTN